MIILVFILVAACETKLSFINSTLCDNAYYGYNYIDVKTQPTYVVTQALSQRGVEAISYEPVGLPRAQYSYQRLDSFYIAQLRATPANLYINGNFLTFDNNAVYIHSNFTTASMKRLNLSNFGGYAIADACFGASLNEIYVLAAWGTTYSLWIFNSSLRATIIKNISVNAGYGKDNMVCESGKIFISFQGQVHIYAQNSTLNLLFSANYSMATIEKMDLHANNEIFVYSYSNVLFVYNHTISPYTLIKKYTYGSIISGLTIMAPSYIIFTDGVKLCQYDYEINTIINSLSTSLRAVQRVYGLSNGKLILTRDLMISPYNDPYMYYYLMDSNYSCINCTSCYQTYILDSAKQNCTKIKSLPPSAVPSLANVTFTPAPVPVWINITLNLTNVTTSSRNSIAPAAGNSTAVPVVPVTEQPGFDVEDNLKKTFMRWKMEFNNTVAFNAASSVLMVSSIKLSPQFLLSLWLVFDDISFYAYHAKEYPYVVQFFFSKIEIIVRDRLDPWFLQVVDALNASTPYALNNNAHMREYMAIPSLDSQQVFFTRSFLENYRNSVYMTVFIFIILKLVQLLLWKFKDKCGCFGFLYKWSARNSQWWLGTSSIVEGLLSKAAFDFGVQSILPNCSSFMEKVNLMVCFAFYFLLVMYVLVFYSLVFSNTSRRNAKMLLMPCRYSFYSFLYQPLLILLRILIRTFIHSFLLPNYTIQIFMLFLTDLFFIGVCLKMRRYFHNIFIFGFSLLYMLAFATFDLFFYLETIQALAAGTKRELFSMIALGIIFGSSFMISMTFLIGLVSIYLKLLCKTVSKGEGLALGLEGKKRAFQLAQYFDENDNKVVTCKVSKMQLQKIALATMGNRKIPAQKTVKIKVKFPRDIEKIMRNRLQIRRNASE